MIANAVDMRPMRNGGRRVRLGARLLREERGMVLVMALGIMFLLTVTLGTVLFLTASGARDSQRTNAGQKAHGLAEAGINNAVAVLNGSYPATGYPGNPNLLPLRTSTYSPTGSVDWSGTLVTAPAGIGWGAQWNLTATGSVTNPTGPGTSAVKRTVTAIVPVIIPISTPVGSNNPLNFIYSFQDLTFPQSVTVASPVYATRDLILQNSSLISEFIGNDPTTPNRAAVGRDLYLTQNANKLGHVNGATDPTYDLGEVHIVNKCSTKSNSLTLHACVWGNTDQIWAVTHDNVIPPNFLTFTPQLTCCYPYPDQPTLAPAQGGPAGTWSNMGGVYIGADIGPRSPCTTGSVPFTFDGAAGEDDSINNSATPAGSSAIDLTPGSSYTCTTRAGELSWNNSTKKLRVQGLVFIDGSATISSGASAQATVTGQGVIFLTGTFMMKNALMCVKIDPSTSGSNTHCLKTAGAWDPNVGALIIVADGDGGYDSTQGQSNNVISGQGINIKGSDFQGGLIANKDINVDTTSQMQGPMISVYHNVIAGQSNVLTFPPLQFAPGGGGEIGPTPTPQLLPPRQFGGG